MRLLKPSGRHVFTVPFHQTAFHDEVRPRVVNEEMVYDQPPMYHVDPLRPVGGLVYRIFSLEMLLKLDELGFRTYRYRFYDPILGLLGANALTSEAIRVGSQ